MLQPIRRIVTGHDEHGTATVHIDDKAAERLEFPGWAGAGSTELWSTDETPVDLDIGHDRARPMRHDPTDAGSLFRIVQIPPGDPDPDGMDAVYDAMGSAHRPEDPTTQAHPTMHRTDSIDYLVVLSGELTMLMEDGTEVTMQPTDCIVQQGTKHAWINRGSTPVLLAAVLLDAHRTAGLPTD